MEKQQFLVKYQALQVPAKAELREVLRLWLVEAKSDLEIAKALGKKAHTTGGRKIVEICKHFGTDVWGDGDQRKQLVYLFRKYCSDFEVHPSIYPDWVDGNLSDRPSTSTNPQNIPTSEPIPELTTLEFIGRDANNHENNIVQNVRDKVRDWIELRCEDIRFADGQHRNVKNFHVEISCDSNSKRRMPLIDCVKSHYYRLAEVTRH